ncbi:MAG: alpha/beta hydrolase [Anaerolineae bacterium]|nr:alpha/beta hydrolase [Anaerolineae bacterium]
MRASYRFVGPLMLLVVVWVGQALPLHRLALPAHAQEPAPQFEAVECHDFGINAVGAADCGYLIVPEDRGDPDSPEIHLAVIVLRSTSNAPAPDPVIYLVGGPGGDTVRAAQNWARYPVRNTRDIILLDQRGTGLSQPLLDCPEMDRERMLLLGEDVTTGDWIARMMDAITVCHTRLTATGVNLAAYNSATNAADVADLRVALGYDEWNLYGISYGTRLALTVMRDHPAGVRSVILDSVYPPDVDLYTALAPNAMRAFDTLFAGCAADAYCAEKYGDLETLLWETVAQLDADPPVVTVTHPLSGERITMRLTGALLIETLFNALYRAGELSRLPSVIQSVHNGRYTTFSNMAIGYQIIPEFIADGMMFSVQCHEEIIFGTAEAYRASFVDTGISGVERLADLGALDIAACALWGAGDGGAVENEPVQSAIPTLVMAGQYDPITPPEWAAQTAAHLDTAYYYEYPGLAHGTSRQHQCAVGMLLAFLDDPTAAPDASCIDAMEPVYFR